MKSYKKYIFAFLAILLLVSACGAPAVSEPVRESDVTELQRQDTENLSDEIRQVLVERYGYAVEPELLAERIRRTNDPAALEYVYIVSPYTGEIILRATAVGKVVSSTKRLDVPESYELTDQFDCGEYNCKTWLSFERIGTDGSYGSSTPRLFWFDTSGQKFEVAVGGAVLVTTERPYIFENSQIDLSIDIRLQSQIDPEREAQRIAIADYIRSNTDWRPGDEIPLEVLLDAWELYGDKLDILLPEPDVEVTEPDVEPAD